MQTFLCLLIGFSLFKNSIESSCFDISTNPRECKDLFTVYLMLAVGQGNLDKINTTLKLVQPILQPCIHLEMNSTEEKKSVIRFPALPSSTPFPSHLQSQSQKDHSCLSHSFPEIYGLNEWPTGSVFSINKDSLSNNERFIEWMNSTLKLSQHCDLYSKRVTVFFLFIKVKSSDASEKFKNLSKRLKKEDFDIYRKEGFLLKIFWIKEDNDKFDGEMLKLMKNARNFSAGYIDWIIDNLTDTKSVSQQYGMCFSMNEDHLMTELIPINESIEKENEPKKWALLSIGIILCLLSMLLCIVFCYVYRERALKRPIHFSSTYLQRRTDPNAVEDENEGPPRYVAEQSIFQMSLRSREGDQQEEQTAERQI